MVAIQSDSDFSSAVEQSQRQIQKLSAVFKSSYFKAVLSFSFLTTNRHDVLPQGKGDWYNNQLCITCLKKIHLFPENRHELVHDAVHRKCFDQHNPSKQILGMMFEKGIIASFLTAWAVCFRAFSQNSLQMHHLW